ncbi:MAG: hypothetical protein JWN44_3394 [Myxococcales bacterium]|nr:hypothetical protein [Myxococcales bacterium]
MQIEGSMEWVRRAGDYRVLVGKRDRLGFPLGELEQARLAELERFFMQDANRRRMPWATREQIRAPISLFVQFGDSVGRAQDISPDGMYVVTSAPLFVGARTVIRINEEPYVVRETDGDEDETPYEQWQFGAEIVRLDAAGMGLRFIGIPLALRIVHTHPLADDDVQHAA